MVNKLNNTKFLTLIGMLLALEIILAFTPLGFIPLGFMNATTVHIPVIIGAIFLGPLGGSILGAVFGLTSVIQATTAPVITSFVFSPFVQFGGMQGNGLSLVVAIVPRVMIGIMGYYSYKWMQKWFGKSNLSYLVAGIVGSMTNTLLVLGSIYIFFGKQYAEAINIAHDALIGMIMLTVGTNGIPEAIIAAILVASISKALRSIYN